MIGAFIVCENCVTADFYSLVPKSWITKWAREKGWSIGKQHLCPDCRKNKKSAGGRAADYQGRAAADTEGGTKA